MIKSQVDCTVQQNRAAHTAALPLRCLFFSSARLAHIQSQCVTSPPAVGERVLLMRFSETGRLLHNPHDNVNIAPSCKHIVFLSFWNLLRLLYSSLEHSKCVLDSKRTIFVSGDTLTCPLHFPAYTCFDTSLIDTSLHFLYVIVLILLFSS